MNPAKNPITIVGPMIPIGSRIATQNDVANTFAANIASNIKIVGVAPPLDSSVMVS